MTSLVAKDTADADICCFIINFGTGRRELLDKVVGENLA